MNKLRAVPDDPTTPPAPTTSVTAPEVHATAVSGRRTLYVTVRLGELEGAAAADEVYVTVYSPHGGKLGTGAYRSVRLPASAFRSWGG